jgi:PAS domain S-box-containing protein
MLAHSANDFSGNILIVEEDTNSREVLSDLLMTHGYEVRIAHKGVTVLDSIHKHPPDIVLMSARLSDMDAYEICERLKADRRYAHIMVIFLTAQEGIEERGRGFAAGGVDIISKPFHPEEVVARVRTHIDLGRLRGQFEAQVRQQAAALDESEARHRSIVEAAPLCILAVREGRFVSVNPAGCRMLGFSHPEEMIGMPAMDIVAPESQAEIAERIGRFASGQNNPLTELVLKHKKGHKIIVESSSVSVRIDGQVTGIVFAHDISRRKAMEMNLRDSEARLNAFMDNFPAAIYVKDSRLKHIYANAYLLNSFDSSFKDFVGTTAHTIFPPEIAEALERCDCEVRDSGVSQTFDIEHVMPDGERRWYQDIKFPIRLKDGSVLIGGISLDISERKRRELALRMMQYSIDHCLDRIAWIAPDGRFLYANEAACQEMHYTREQVLSMGVYDVDPDFPRERWREHFQNLKNVGSMRLEAQQRDGRGEIHFVDVVSNYNRFGDKEFICSFARDITELKNSEAALKAACAKIEVLNRQLEAESTFLKQEIKLEHDFESIVGNSNALKYALFMVEQVAPTDSTVLILGETGTGKELIARAIHNSSQRSRRTLVKVNCATLPAELIESELFGHERGAFTGADKRKPGRFEIADGSTLFLDEIGELPMALQAKLLRILEDSQYERLGGTDTLAIDVRIIAATNRDLKQEVRKGRFREDLWYRLNVYTLSVPSLRERIEDIDLLVPHFVQLFSKKFGKPVPNVSVRALRKLKGHTWPGNIRELQHVIERALITWQSGSLRFEDLQTGLNQVSRPGREADSHLRPMVAIERRHIRRVLDATGGKIDGPGGAAEILGLNASTLRSRMKKLRIQRTR